GVHYEVEILSPATHSTRSEACRTVTSFGLLGGKPGGIARVRWSADGGRSAEDMVQYGNTSLEAGRLIIESPGGGGFGAPSERPPALVAEDVRDGVVSVEGAARDYGVALDPETYKVDEKKTEALRREMA
ncbi:MAG: hydantoinase B/oxoprolinase family protein, partial [bacterium]